MGSCLSAESRSPRSGSPSGAFGVRKTKKRLGSYRRDALQKIPGRVFLNGATEFALLFTQQGKKGTNQDAMIVWENFASRSDTIFCGVFDGHGPYGHMVAKRVRDYLPQKLTTHWEVNIESKAVLREISLNSSSMNSEDTSFISADEESGASIDIEETEKHPEIFQTLKESFLKAFRVMDRELRVHARTDCYCSGTTAVTLIKQCQDLVIGNVGDSRAVLATRDDYNSLIAVQLTVDLKPNLPEEEERIKKCKGRVFALQDEPGVFRVWLPNSDSPGLAMARAFGDFCLKDFGLIAVPDVSYRRLTEKDEFVILATDGIWDVLSNEEVVDIVASAPSRSTSAKTLVESAVRAWKFKYPTSKIDDCAAVCLFLDSNTNNVSTSSNANQKDHTTDTATEQDRSGTVRTVKDVLKETSEEEEEDEESSKEDDVSPEDWSALEGVTRVNTLLTLPRFILGKDEKEDHGATKSRK